MVADDLPEVERYLSNEEMEKVNWTEVIVMSVTMTVIYIGATLILLFL
jgi:hypothetical protein